MNYQDLLRYEQLGLDAPAELHWQALIALEPCLENFLVEVGEVRFEHGVPCRLTTCRLGDIDLYLAVTELGDIHLGKVNELAQYRTLRLGDFDPQYSEVNNPLFVCALWLIGPTVRVVFTCQAHAVFQKIRGCQAPALATYQNIMMSSDGFFETVLWES